MKYLIGSLAILISLNQVGLLSPAFAAAPRRREAPPPKPRALAPAAATLKQMTVESLSKWMTYYYLNPDPETLVPALLFADKQGLLQGGSAAPLQAFASRIFAQNPDKIKDWFARFAPMSEPGKTVVMTSIWWANTKEGKELLQSIAVGLSDKGKAEFQKQIDSTPPQVDTMDIESPDVLDMLWGCFCATGDTKYVKRLMSTLSWGKSDAKDLPRMLIASAARWSLVSNVNQHEKVKEFCISTASQDAELKPYLENVLAEATKALAKANLEKQGDVEKQADNGKQAAKDKQGYKERQADPDKPAADSDKQAAGDQHLDPRKPVASDQQMDPVKPAAADKQPGQTKQDVGDKQVDPGKPASHSDKLMDPTKQASSDKQMDPAKQAASDRQIDPEKKAAGNPDKQAGSGKQADLPE